MDGYISYSPFFYAMYKVEFNTATWYWYYFHNKGKHHPGRQVLPKEQDQQLSLIDSILCFNSELLLSRVIQFANQSPFFFFTHVYIMFYSAVLKSTSPTHFNKPIKLLYEGAHHLLPHQHLCHLKDVSLTSAFFE